MTADLRAFGGKLIVPVGDTADFAAIMSRPVTQQIWDFGNIVPELRDPTQIQAHEEAEAAMAPAPVGRVTGSWQDNGGIVAAWDPIKALNGDKHMRTLWQQTGSCFPAGTPVRMADGGEKAIEDIVVGDVVLTHTGAARKVLRTMVRNYTGEMVTLTPHNFPFPLTMTSDHPVGVVNKIAHRRLGNISWKEAGELSQSDRCLVGYVQEQADDVIDAAEFLGDTCVILDDLMDRGAAPAITRPDKSRKQCVASGIDWRGRVKTRDSKYENAIYRRIRITPSFARLVGLYLAEGGCHDHRVVFSLHRKEDWLADEIISLVEGIFGVSGGYKWLSARPDRKNTLYVKFDNVNLVRFFEGFTPGNVYTKRVPGSFMRARKDTRLALLMGWATGDGHMKFKRVGIFTGSTVSPGLARDLVALAVSCDVRAACRRIPPRPGHAAAYTVSFSGGNAFRLIPAIASQMVAAGRRLTTIDMGRTRFGYARRIKTLEAQHVVALPVYDLEVEEDHSFIAGGLVVHNCTAQGLAYVLLSMLGEEIYTQNEFAQKFAIPCTLFNYGLARYRGGDRGQGEGAVGSIIAMSAARDGYLDNDLEGLPPLKFPDANNASWGKAAELRWSDGSPVNGPAKPFLETGRKHLVGTVTRVRDGDQGWSLLRNRYWQTVASDWGGLEKVPVTGNPGVLLNRRVTTWRHQQSFLGSWDHPELGELVYMMNSWRHDFHGACPSGAWPGGFWIRKKPDYDYLCRNGEVYAFSNLGAYPARPRRTAI